MNKEKFEYFWSRKNFVDKVTGECCRDAVFCGSDREWCETLVEVIYDARNSILRRRNTKTLPSNTELMVNKSMMDAIATSVLYKAKSAVTGDRRGHIGSLDLQVVEYELPGGPVCHFVMPTETATKCSILATIRGLDFDDK